jgi:hypothetical protein
MVVRRTKAAYTLNRRAGSGGIGVKTGAGLPAVTMTIRPVPPTVRGLAAGLVMLGGRR